MHIPMELIKANSDFLRQSRAEISALLPSIWGALDPIFGLSETSESNTWVSYNKESGFLVFSSSLVFEAKNVHLFDSVLSLKQNLSVLGDIEFDMSSCRIFLSDGSVVVEAYKDLPQIVFKFYLVLPSAGLEFDEQSASGSYFSFIQEEGLLRATGSTKVVKKEQELAVEVDDLYKNL